jgi:hypothetical protein
MIQNIKKGILLNNHNITEPLMGVTIVQASESIDEFVDFTYVITDNIELGSAIQV